MPKSKLRGGAKTHRKRIKNRTTNKVVKSKQLQEKFEEILKTQMEERQRLKSEMSGATTD